jgi:hypothetical protein
MKSTAGSVKEYLAGLPADRRSTLSAVRKVILDNLAHGYREVLSLGMIAYVIPLERYPDTYNGQPLILAALASQKNYMSLYLMCVYDGTPIASWFREELRKTGRKLDMGKSCIRFRNQEDLPLDLVGRTIARVSVDSYITVYEKSRLSRR